MSPIGFPGLAILAQIPVLIVWLVGIVLAVARWSRHPRVSLIAVIGLAILAVQAVLSSFVFPWLQVALMRSMAFPRMGLLATVAQAFGALVRALGWGLVLAAVFLGRESSAV
jgi:hypothetical protein